MSFASSQRVPDPRTVVWSAGVPAFVGLAALVEGYPVPVTVSAAIGVLAGGVVLAATGRFAQWCRAQGLLVAPATVVVGVVGSVVWAFLKPGVSSAPVAGSTVIAGDPVIARFVGGSPLLFLIVGCTALLEGSILGTGGAPWLARFRGVGSVPALKHGLACGVAVLILSLAPGFLLGNPVSSVPLLGVAALGALGGTAVGYLWVGHRIHAPVAVLLLVAAAALVGIATGGSPRGFPVAWGLWVVPGLALGGIEAVGTWLRRRVRSTEPSTQA